MAGSSKGVGLDEALLPTLAAEKTSEGGTETAIPRNYTESKQFLNELLDRTLRISEAAYRRIRGSGGERSEPPEGGGRGGPSGGGSEPPSGAETPAETPSLKPSADRGPVTLGMGLGASSAYVVRNPWVMSIISPHEIHVRVSAFAPSVTFHSCRLSALNGSASPRNTLPNSCGSRHTAVMLPDRLP